MGFTRWKDARLRKCSSPKRFSGSGQTHILFMQTCFLLSICNLTVSLRRARECGTCENNSHCILIFSRPPRYQSCSRAARISFLHNIYVAIRDFMPLVGNISKRSIKRLNKVRTICFDTVRFPWSISTPVTPIDSSHTQNPIVIYHFRTYLKRLERSIMLFVIRSSFLLNNYFPLMLLTVSIFNTKMFFFYIYLWIYHYYCVRENIEEWKCLITFSASF